LDEPTKVKYLFYLYNYYYNILMEPSIGNAWLLELSGDNVDLQEIEDNFIIKYNLDTTTLVGIRRLVSRLQKEVAKQRIYKKEEVASDNQNCPL